MKILFSHYAVLDKEGFGRTFMLAREAARLGHETVLFTTLASGNFVWPVKKEVRDNVHIFAFPDVVPMNLRRTGFGFLSLLLRCIYVIRFKFDVVVGDNGHRPSSGWPCKLHRLLYGAKYITEWWDFFGRGGQFDNLTMSKKIFKGWYDLATEVPDKNSADGVIVLSLEMRNRAINLGLPEEKIAIVAGGADTDGISFFPTTEWRSLFNIPENAFVLGFAGMNEGEFLDSLEFVKAIQTLKSDLPIIWLTTGRKLSEATKLKYNIGNELLEFGWVDYALYGKLLSCADAFLLLQQNNLCNKTRWPNKFGDYLAGGRVVLTNPIGELDYFCKQYPQYFRDVTSSKTTLEDQLRALFAERLELVKYRSEIRSLAETEFSWKCRMKEFDKFVTRLIR